MKNRKTLYIVLSILLIFIFTLTIVYAALNTVLNITGTAEVTAASWDIHFDNIQITPGSVLATKEPEIIDSKTVNFTVTLKEPGDYYKFTVDVVNDGSIDAMIDSVVKTPQLTEEQAKYIKYEIEYSTGASLNSKQLLSKESAKTLSVTVGYRTDLTSTDLPTTSTNLSLSFTLVYTQADTTTTIEPGAEKSPVKVVSGDFNTIGSEIAIGDEHFYVISSDETSVTMLSKYNLYVGKECTTNYVCIEYGEEATGIQNMEMLAFTVNTPTKKGTIQFSTSGYWSTDTYPIYVYNSNSVLYPYIENYKTYLEGLGITIKEARLITYEELSNLGCSYSELSCPNAPDWVYLTSYWTGTAGSSNGIYYVRSDNNLYIDGYTDYYFLGVRPVITISK